MIIKILLLLGLVGTGMYAYRRSSSATHLVVRRLAGLAVLISGAISVLFPSITNWAASLVGVERGADLVFYTMTVLSLFVWSSVYSRLHDLEERYIELVRRVAIDEANPAPAPQPRRELKSH